jgi:hypothetical protein
MSTEPNWQIKPTFYESFKGGSTYGLDTQNQLWLVAIVDQNWVDFNEEFDGNTAGLQVGDFEGVIVGCVADPDNILIAVDEAELEAAALVAQARAEFA